jgi:AcrR family transcriptional regulator
MAPVKQPPGRTYGGRTGDQRAAERREALLDAAFELVAANGWRDLNIEATCRRAGLNKRYFYESFSDIDALVAAVMEHLADEAIAVTVAQLEEGGPRKEVSRRAVTALIEHLIDDPRRTRVLFGAVPAGDAAAGHRIAVIRRVIASAASYGRNLYELADDPDVELTAAMLVGGTSQTVLDWLDGRVDCSRDELIAHVVALWCAIGDETTARVNARRVTAT